MSADITRVSGANTPATGQRWGPRRLADGSFRFQLWAPAEDAVDLLLNGTKCPMIKTGDGWHHVETAAAVGSIYGFVLTDGNLVGDPASAPTGP